MKCYVLGAGVSYSVGYPLGSQLFDALNKFVEQSGACVDRFDYRRDWKKLHEWLATNPNPMIGQAYQTKNIEHLFTILDFAIKQRGDALFDIALADYRGDQRSAKVVAFEAFDETIKDFQKYRKILLWALEHYFAWLHYEDLVHCKEEKWGALRKFGEHLQPGDVVITFNYDATLERVLLQQGKWAPTDGYGFDVVLQKSRDDSARISFNKSEVTVLHLHGATGWYRRPAFAPGYEPQGSGAVPIEVFGAAPLETKISLDPEFMKGLGISGVDACLPDLLAVNSERHVVLHPSFVKDYENDSSDSGVLPGLWKKAACALRNAEQTFIVGYSLPRADAAALTLLLTSCENGSVRVINPEGRVKMRIGHLLHSGDSSQGTATFQEWVGLGCPDRVAWKPKSRSTQLMTA